MWSAKDVLAHLVAREDSPLGWSRTGLRVDVPAVPAAGAPRAPPRFVHVTVNHALPMAFPFTRASTRWRPG